MRAGPNVLAVAVAPDVGEVARRLDAGDSVNAIAADLGVTARTIRNRLHAAGLPLASTRSRQRRRSLLADPSWLRRQHVDEGLSAWAIGRELEVSTAEVRATLERFGIERPPVNPHLTADALRTAFADGATVTSIARTAGVDRATVRAALRRNGIENPLAGLNLPRFLGHGVMADSAVRGRGATCQRTRMG
jgi:transposase-like protein